MGSAAFGESVACLEGCSAGSPSWLAVGAPLDAKLIFVLQIDAQQAAVGNYFALSGSNVGFDQASIGHGISALSSVGAVLHSPGVVGFALLAQTTTASTEIGLAWVDTSNGDVIRADVVCSDANFCSLPANHEQSRILAVLDFPDGSSGTSGLLTGPDWFAMRLTARPSNDSGPALAVESVSPSEGLSMTGASPVVVRFSNAPAVWNWLPALSTGNAAGTLLAAVNDTAATASTPNSYSGEQHAFLPTRSVVLTDGRTTSQQVELHYRVTSVESVESWVDAQNPPNGLSIVAGDDLGGALAWIGDADMDGCGLDFAVGLPGNAPAGAVLLMRQRCDSSAQPELLTTISGAGMPAGAMFGVAIHWLRTEDEGNARHTFLAIGAPGGARLAGRFALVRATFADADWSVSTITTLVAGEDPIPGRLLTLFACFGGGIASLSPPALAPRNQTLVVGAPMYSSGLGALVTVRLDVEAGSVLAPVSVISNGVHGMPPGTTPQASVFGQDITRIDPPSGSSPSINVYIAVGAGGSSVYTLLSAPALWLLRLRSELDPTVLSVQSKLIPLPTRIAPVYFAPPQVYFGMGVSWAGDLDGDGLAQELVIGTAGNPSVSIAWLELVADDVRIIGWGSFGAGMQGMPASLPTQFGAAVCAAGDWDGDGIANDIIVGAPLASAFLRKYTGHVDHLQVQANGPGWIAPWGNASLVVHGVSPSKGLPFLQQVELQINGSAMYRHSGSLSSPRSNAVVVSGPAPATCTAVQVNDAGDTLRCTLSASLTPSRTIQVKVGEQLSNPVMVQHDTSGIELQAVTDTDPLSQDGGQSREFTGTMLFPSLWFTLQELQAVGAGDLLIGSTYRCPVSSTRRSVDGASVTCMDMPAGVGGPHTVRLSLPSGFEAMETQVVVSFEPGVVSAVWPAKVTLTSRTPVSVNITGSRFGFSASDVPRVVIGGNDCDDIEWVSSTEVHCLSVYGVFANHDVVVYTGSLPSAGGDGALHFDDPPQVVAVAPQVLPTAGNATISCYGLALGDRIDELLNITVGGAACQDLQVQGPSVVSCVAPGGTGTDADVAVAALSGVTTSSVTMVAYASPVVLSSQPDAAFADPALSYDFAITGKGFGPSDRGQIEALSVGGKPCPGVRHISDEQLQCLGVSPPWPGPRVVSVTVSGQTGSGAVILFQDPPAVQSVEPSVLPSTAGGSLVLITGTGFGGQLSDVDKVLIGDGECAPVSFEVLADGSQRLGCQAPAGTGVGLGVVVFVERNGNSSGNGMPVVSFAPPVVSGLGAQGAPLASTAMGVPSSAVYAGQHGMTIAFNVSNAGGDVSELLVTLTNQPGSWSLECEAVHPVLSMSQIVGATCSNVSLASFPPDGGELFVRVSVSGQVAQSVGSVTVVGRPVVTLVSPATDIPTEGLGNASSAPVQIIGRNLGAAAGDVLSVVVGGQPCPVVQWVAPSGAGQASHLLVALPPGVGMRQRVVVTTRGHLSDESGWAVSYRPALVLSISPSYALTGNGSESFEIEGADFGNTAEQLGGVFIGGRQCVGATWLSPMRVRCPGMARNDWFSHDVAVTVGGQAGTRAALFEPVGTPNVSVVSPRIAGVGDQILLLGTNFGYAATDVARVTVLGVECTGVALRGSTALTCTMPAPPPALANASLSDPSVLRDVPLYIYSAAGRRSPRANITYDGSGATIAAAPSALLVWRPVGASNEFVARWAFPQDSQLPEADPVTSFDMQLLQRAGKSAKEQTLSITVAAMQARGEVTSTRDGWRVWLHADSSFTTKVMSVRVRAVNPSGPGPWSVWSGPVVPNCEAQDFLETQAPEQDWVCGQCPSGAYCGGSAAENVTALPGYWRVPWSVAGLGFVACPQASACLGFTNATLPTVSTSASAAASFASAHVLATAVPAVAADERPTLPEVLAEEQPPRAASAGVGDPTTMERCGEGYTGTMCSQCEVGFSRWGATECRRCKSAGWLWVAVILAVIVVGGFLALSVRSTIRQSHTSTESFTTAAIKVAFSHIQIVGIATSFPLRWPAVIASFLASMGQVSSATSSVLSLDCFLGQMGALTADSSQRYRSRFLRDAALELASPVVLLTLATLIWWLLDAGVFLLCCERCHQQRRRVWDWAHRRTASSSNNPLVHATTADASEAAADDRGVVEARSGNAAAEVGPSDSAAAVVPTTPRTAEGGPGPEAHHSLLDKIITSAVVILFFVHMNVSQTSFELLTCRDVLPLRPDGPLPGNASAAVRQELIAATSGGCNAAETHRRLVQDLDVCCYDPVAQARMYGMGIPGLLLYTFGIPLAAAGLLFHRRHQLTTQHARATLGFLYAGLQPRAYYWESVVMLRKVLVALIVVILQPIGVAFQTYLTLALIFALVVWHARVWPYSDVAINRLELAGLIVAFVTFECGLFLSDASTSLVLAGVATMVLVGSNAVFLLTAVGLIIHDQVVMMARPKWLPDSWCQCCWPSALPSKPPTTSAQLVHNGRLDSRPSAPGIPAARPQRRRASRADPVLEMAPTSSQQRWAVPGSQRCAASSPPAQDTPPAATPVGTVPRL